MTYVESAAAKNPATRASSFPRRKALHESRKSDQLSSTKWTSSHHAFSSVSNKDIRCLPRCAMTSTVTSIASTFHRQVFHGPAKGLLEPCPGTQLDPPASGQKVVPKLAEDNHLILGDEGPNLENVIRPKRASKRLVGKCFPCRDRHRLLANPPLN